MKKNYYFICIILFFMLLIDQLSKFLIIKYIDFGNPMIIIDNLFKFDFVKNTGAAFGFMSSNTLLLVAISVLLIIYIIYEIKKNINNKYTLLSLSFILSGAFGNLIDRLFRGYVVDFLSFKIFGYEMAVFNIADIYITIGVIFLIFIIIREGINERNSSK